MANPAGVKYKEINLGQSVSVQTDMPAAMVFACNQGPTVPTLVTSYQQFEVLYGKRDYKVSYAGYCAEDYFAQGDQLWCRRVINTGYSYGALMLRMYPTDDYPVLEPFVLDGDPALFDTTLEIPITSGSFGPGHTLDGNLVLLHLNGPSLRSDIKLDIISKNIAWGGTLYPATVSSTGGTLEAGTYSYKVSAVNGLGETEASLPCVAEVLAGSTGSVTLNWDPVPGAVAYKVYGRGGLIADLLGSTSRTYFVDTGALTPQAGSPAPVMPTLDITAVFTVRVFDGSISLTQPVESHDVTLHDYLDPYGNQLRIDTVINVQSNYLRAINISASADPQTLPNIFSTAKVAFPAGDPGVAVTDLQLSYGWADFEDTNRFALRNLICAGYSTPTVYQAMVQCAQTRQDSIALLDLPAGRQEAQNAVDYVNNIALLGDVDGRAAVFASDYYSRYQIYVPTSGMMAALSARTSDRFGSFMPIAGLRRGQVNALSMRKFYTEPEHKLLKNAQINFVRKERGRGLFLFEQKTQLKDGSPLSWMSIRYMVDEIHLAAVPFLRTFCHELGSDFTLRQIVSGLTRLCQYYVDAGGLRSFYIDDGSAVNTVVDVASGRLNVYMVLEPLLPVEEIILTGVISPQGVDLSTLVANL